MPRKVNGLSLNFCGCIKCTIIYQRSACTTSLLHFHAQSSCCNIALCMQFSTKVGRQKMLKLIVNIVRWVRTVDHMHLLPPGPPSAINSTFFHDSPYPGKAPASFVEKMTCITCQSSLLVGIVWLWLLHHAFLWCTRA